MGVVGVMSGATDPFAEFEQVEEKKIDEQEAPQAISNYIEEERRKMNKAASFEQLANLFSEEHQEQAEKDFQKRQAHYELVRAKEDEIESITERLYVVRYDKSLNGDEVLMQCKNLLAELNRLNEELAQIREKGLQKFVKSLELDEIGISRRMKTSSFRTPSKVIFEGSSDAAPEEKFSLSQYASTGAYGFMRTKSTGTFEQQPPNEKWKSLYKMYKEWKYQKGLADAQRLASQGLAPEPNSQAAATFLKEEKTKLRQSIYAMRQRKNLSASDQQLLQVLQQKLKALNNI